MDLNASRWAPRNSSTRSIVTPGQDWNYNSSIRANRARAQITDHFEIDLECSKQQQPIVQLQPAKEKTTTTRTTATITPLYGHSNHLSPISPTTASSLPSAYEIETPTPTPPKRPLRSAFHRAELVKHFRLLRRLYWKTTLLYLSYQRTRAPSSDTWPGTGIPIFVPPPNHILDPNPATPKIYHTEHAPERSGPSSANSQSRHAAEVEAEAMFKLDFFEWFVLLERSLVHLLAAVNVTIPRQSSQPQPHPQILTQSHNRTYAADVAHPPPAPDATPAIFATRGRTHPQLYSHRFHANVLLTLSQRTNPLYAVLGTGEIHKYLSIAKEARNRWKESEPCTPIPALPYENGHADPLELRFLALLGTVDLHAMLSCILHGLEAAGNVAEEWVRDLERRERQGSLNGDLDVDGGLETEMEMEWDAFAAGDSAGRHEEPWEAVSDAMDLDEGG